MDEENLLNPLIIVLLCFVLGFQVKASLSSSSSLRLEQLAAENERLRLFNARRERFLRHVPATVSARAVSKASHLMGTPPSIIVALYQTENGPPDIETGNHGKTDYWVKNFPQEYWQALEGTKTLNRLCWEWFLVGEGKSVFKKMLERTARIYTNMDAHQQRSWVNNFIKFEERYRTQKR